MILYEFEGKNILSEAGIHIPKFQLVKSSDLDSSGFVLAVTRGVVLKAQVLSGNRARLGGIIVVEDGDSGEHLSKLFNQTINGEPVAKVLIEEKVEYDREYYLSISYDTDTRSPILSLSESGGTGIEERGIQVFPIDPINPEAAVQKIAFGIPNELVNKFIKIFFDNDCVLLEINPLVKASSKTRGSPSTSPRHDVASLRTNFSLREIWLALDAKIKLDDDAKGRHPEWDYPDRSAPGHTPTKSEIEAKKIDQGDYRGVAGSTYFDLDGDIAILASGGGVSLTAMDALITAGGRPANYTEYSGNPSKDKVTKLTKVVLGKPKINGLWIIGTVAANFTDIYETLSGIIDGLRQAEKELDEKFNFPIVIRRGGPRDKEAFEMLRKVTDFNLHLQGEETSIAESAKIMADQAKKYKEKQ